MHINIKRYNTEQQQALEYFATTALLCWDNSASESVKLLVLF